MPAGVEAGTYGSRGYLADMKMIRWNRWEKEPRSLKLMNLSGFNYLCDENIEVEIKFIQVKSRNTTGRQRATEIRCQHVFRMGPPPNVQWRSRHQLTFNDRPEEEGVLMPLKFPNYTPCCTLVMMAEN